MPILFMQKIFRPILTDLLWLSILLIATVSLAIYNFGWTFLKSKLNIHLADTYFVFPVPTIILPVFLLTVFTVFIIKEIHNGFGRTIPNITIFISGLLLIVLITMVNKEFIGLGTSFSGGWTAYPPLSELPPDGYPGTRQENSVVKVVTNMLIIFQHIVTIALLYVSFRWGQKYKAANIAFPESQTESPL